MQLFLTWLIPNIKWSQSNNSSHIGWSLVNLMTDKQRNRVRADATGDVQVSIQHVPISMAVSRKGEWGRNHITDVISNRSYGYGYKILPHVVARAVTTSWSVTTLDLILALAAIILKIPGLWINDVTEDWTQLLQSCQYLFYVCKCN